MCLSPVALAGTDATSPALAKVEACLVRALRRIHFPAPRGQDAYVTVELRLSPDGHGPFKDQR